MFKNITIRVFILCLSVSLAACDSAEERAQKHFEKGIALLEEGDVDRAIIEFRNVFKLNGEHKEARIIYAEIQEDRGNIQGAYGQYLRLIEQYPENLVGRRALIRMSIQLNDWEEAERHVAVAEKIAPEDPVVLSARAGIDYREAIRNENKETAQLAVEISAALLLDTPDLPAARNVVIDDRLRRQDWVGALAVIDAGLAVDGEENLYVLRLGVLERLGRKDEVVAQMKDMVQLFPDAGLHQMLVRRYLAEGRLDDAEAYLRERAASDRVEDIQPLIELIAFLDRWRGQDAAVAEIDQLLEQDTPYRAQLRASRAAIDFAAGNRDAALLEMEDILKEAENSEDIDRLKVGFARMLTQTGNSVGARAQIEEVLAHDPSQVEAIKMKAGWLIEDDRPGDALVDLRTALDQSPRDPEIMTLMARAHERTGNRDLMGEMLALAVEASRNDPEASLRYSRYLEEQEKFLAAEDILKEALRVQRNHPMVLTALGGLYIVMDDWARAQHVIDTLERLGTDQGLALSNELTARKLAGQNQSEELEKFLKGLAKEGSGLQASASIIRLRLAQNDFDGALAYIDDLSVNDAMKPALRFLRAGVLIAAGQRAEGGETLQALSEEFPENEAVWMALYRLRLSQGDDALAVKALEDGMRALPNSANLRWASAGDAERKGDIDGAILIYEDLYSQYSASTVIANNLASLISSYRADDESLQRSYDIARRLRGTEVPAFQDTYGWIAYRLGNYDEAVEYLEPAAKALTVNPIVQFHLAENYVALGRSVDALEQYRKVVALVETSESTRRPEFMDKVETEIARLVEELN